MAVPHLFPSLIQEPGTQTLVIAGAGLSHAYVPLVDELRDGLVKAAQELGIAPTGNFYELAEVILNGSTAAKSDAESRLWLAEHLGLFDDRRWFGEVGLPLTGNTPRHRAIARFAVEKRLKAIVSLNWDTLLEAALESVGLAETTGSPRPWEITARASVVADSDLGKLANTSVFPVIKPHGCVRNLEQARRQFKKTGEIPPIIFKLTKKELDEIPPSQENLIDRAVKVHIAACPLIAVGWKATEKYLRMAATESAGTVTHQKQDAFTLIDLCWNADHASVAAAYGKTEVESFAAVLKDSMPTTDCLFQWLQARYALTKLMASSTASRATLEALLQQLGQPVHDHFIVRWVDGWLPTWVRLCWRAGAMQGNNPHTNMAVEPWDIPVIPRDVHVPWGTMTGHRRELQAAAKLLTLIGSDLSRFDFQKFPGGLWDINNRALYITLPGWKGPSQPAELAALQPMAEELRGLGFIKNIRLIWLDAEDVPPNQNSRHQLAAQVSRLMPLQKFAQSDALTWVELTELKEAPHERVA